MKNMHGAMYNTSDDDDGDVNTKEKMRWLGDTIAVKTTRGSTVLLLHEGNFQSDEKVNWI